MRNAGCTIWPKWPAKPMTPAVDSRTSPFLRGRGGGASGGGVGNVVSDSPVLPSGGVVEMGTCVSGASVTVALDVSGCAHAGDLNVVVPTEPASPARSIRAAVRTATTVSHCFGGGGVDRHERVLDDVLALVHQQQG